MSIATELEQIATNLNSALTEINTQLTAKGGTASSTVYGVASAVENLPSGSTPPLTITKAVGVITPLNLNIILERGE